MWSKLSTVILILLLVFLTPPKLVEHLQCFLLLNYNYLNFALLALEEPPSFCSFGPPDQCELLFWALVSPQMPSEGVSAT